MSESSSKDEMLRKAREYVENHKRKSRRGNSGVCGSNDGEDSKRKRRRKEKDHHDSSDEESEDDDNGRRRRKSDKKKKKIRSSSSLSSSRSRSSTRTRDEEKKKKKKKETSKHEEMRQEKDKDTKKKKKGKEMSDDEGSTPPIRSRNKEKKKSSSSSSSSKKKHSKKEKRKDADSSDDERKKKRHKKKHHKEEKKRSSSSSSSKTKTTRRDNTKIEKITSLLGPINHEIPKTKISPQDDYFTYHNHLRLYLYHTAAKYFEDLSSSETHEAFETFCHKYNQGELEQAYYNENKTLPPEALEACKRTKHKWNFNTNSTEQKSLDMIKSGVKKQTEYQNSGDRSVLQPKLQLGMTYCTPVSGGTSSGIMPAKKERPMIPQRNDGGDDESNKQSEILKKLGLKGVVTPGQKITIAPRK